MENFFEFMLELDKLKTVYRQSYLTDFSRNENSAEHSWHLAIAILTLKEELNINIDFFRAVKMALVHDICEIGAGDISVYDPDRSKKEVEERAYLAELSKSPIKFTAEIKELWEEYEAQQTKESRWVKVVDRLLPLMINLATDGKSWKKMEVSRDQVVNINKIIKEEAPQIYDWLITKIDEAVEKGWLKQK